MSVRTINLLIKRRDTVGMQSYLQIKSRSVSEKEIVLSFNDTMELLNVLAHAPVEILGWEGWLKYKDGRLGHSKEHQGTSDLSHLPKISALALVKNTVTQNYADWLKKPEVDNADLLFCITTNI